MGFFWDLQNVCGVGVGESFRSGARAGLGDLHLAAISAGTVGESLFEEKQSDVSPVT